MVAINTENTRPVTLDRTQLELIQTPEPTLTWSPIPHHHLVDKVKDRLDQKATALSLEEQQKLCIARLLPVKPGILLMDEPC